MSKWDEFKEDIGCGWSVAKWIFFIVLFLVAGSCLVHSCISEWKELFGG